MRLRKVSNFRHSVVFRLTVWYAGLFSLSLVCAFLAFYLVILHNSHGISHHAVSELEEELLQYFSFPVALVVVLSAVGGWLMARRALSGVNEIKRAAIEISKGALDRRVPIKGRRDEIDELAGAFNEMVDQIQALILQMKEMTDNIAHDLRSPIARMRGVAELALTNDALDEAHSVMTGTIVEECDRLLSIINTMLDISEAEAGLAAFHPQQTDLAKLMSDLCDFYQPLAEDRRIDLTIEVPDTLPISGDRPKLQRTFANLLDNSLKYTPPGGRIRIVVSGDESFVDVTVEDSGVGIHERELPHVFDRFFRGERSRSAPGNGLGLSLARAFVFLHKGTIALRSQIGKGSQVVVKLPRA